MAHGIRGALGVRVSLLVVSLICCMAFTGAPVAAWAEAVDLSPEQNTETEPSAEISAADEVVVLEEDLDLADGEMFVDDEDDDEDELVLEDDEDGLGLEDESKDASAPSIAYYVHRQTYGWEGAWAHKDGQVSGTTGQSKRLEGIKIKLARKPFAGSVQYRTHIQTYGWEKSWRKDGALSGTTGKSKRLEAIQVKLTGDVAKKYDVYYRVHAQHFGWMGWAKNGAQAGTAGYAFRLEAIQILLKPKGGVAPATTYLGIRQTTSQAFRSKTPSTGVTVRGPKSAGALKVKGNKLVDKNGKAIQLRGVSTHGLAWYPGYVNEACFKELRTKWGVNVVRFAMYTEEYGGYCSGGSKKELRALVTKGVKAAAKNDLYAIVDWHILSDGNPLTHVKEAKSFFKTMSASLKGYDNVIYEICNEPNGGTSWADIKKYANQVIPQIRANDADAVVLVGTPTWSQEVDKAAASPLSQSNVMYTLHFYAATHKDDLRNRLATVVKGGLPVFVSEFGICDASGNGSIDQKSANSWVSTMNSLGVSWCMWSLCNKAESASIIQSSCTATSGFRTGDLTTSGKWLLKALDGSLPAGTVAQGEDENPSDTQPTPATPVTFSSGNLACKVTLSSSWDAGGGKTCYQYDLSIKNTGASCTSWSVTVPFNKSIAFANGWNATFKASGSKLTVRNASYNGSIARGETITGIGFQVTAASGLKISS